MERSHLPAKGTTCKDPQVHPVDHASRRRCAGKHAAVALYLHGILSLDRVQALFDRHPEWMSA